MQQIIFGMTRKIDKMSNSSSFRSDGQLEAILYEVGYWTVKGQQWQVLCCAASLGHAIEKSARYGMSGVVAVLCRQPGDNIIVFPAQLGRLRSVVWLAPHGMYSGNN